MFKTVALLFFCIITVSKYLADIDAWSRVPTCDTITSSNLCVQIGKKIYLVNAQQKLNWFAAQRYCQQFDANLVTIEDSNEMKLMSDYLRSKGHTVDWYNNGPAFWTSGVDLGSQPGIFYSVTNGDFLPYTAWAKNQPDNDRGVEHCVHIWYLTNTQKFTMNDYECGQPQNFICEFKERLPNETAKTAVCDA